MIIVVTETKIESLGPGIVETLIYPLISLVCDISEEVSGFLRGKIRWMFTREPMKEENDEVHAS